MKLRWHLKSKVNTYVCHAIRFDTIHKRKGDKESHEGLAIVTTTLEGERIELILSPEEVELFVAKGKLLKERFADPDKIPDIKQENTPPQK